MKYVGSGLVVVVCLIAVILRRQIAVHALAAARLYSRKPLGERELRRHEVATILWCAVIVALTMYTLVR